MLWLCSSAPVCLLKTWPLGGARSQQPVLIIYLRFCCLKDAAWLLISWSSLSDLLLHSTEAVSPSMSRRPHVCPWQPSGSGTLVTSHLPANLAARTSREEEDGGQRTRSLLCFHQSERRISSRCCFEAFFTQSWLFTALLLLHSVHNLFWRALFLSFPSDTPADE